MNARRALLRSLLAAPALGAGAWLAGPRRAAAADYRALVVLSLTGGNDGSNCLVPTDGGYADYERARGELALPRSSLVGLPGLAGGRAYGLHPALTPLAPLYDSGRLAWIANVGPLIVPATAAQVMDRVVPVPPYLMSHFEQIAIQQGWGGDADLSGWGGRALEQLPPEMRSPLSAVTFDSNRTLVLGRRSKVSWMSGNPGGLRYWGRADLSQTGQPLTRDLSTLPDGHYANAYTAEYARTMKDTVADAQSVVAAYLAGAVPANDFGSGPLADILRTLSTVLPAFRAAGHRRQVFLVNWGGFDTHGSQRGTAERTQDYQLDQLARAIAGFDTANRASGVDGSVVTLVMSDFGRTLRPASGGGSDHAWGNHWFAFGTPVVGRQVIGTFPQLVLGGRDDFDLGRGGRFVPTTATDQVAATLLRWLGLEASRLPEVLPNLANFASSDLGLLHSV